MTTAHATNPNATTVAQPATATQPLAERLSDRFHPVLVKELRQATRSGFLTASLTLVLATQVCVLAFAISAANTSTITPEAGSNALAISTFVTLLIAIVVVPCAFGIRLSAERAEFSELIASTPLGNQSILNGKIKTAVLLELLLASSTLPFMALTYLLRGIDLLSVAIIAVVDTAIATMATVYALSIASFVISTVARIFAAAIILFGLLIALYIATAFSVAAIYGAGFLLSQPMALVFLGMFLLVPAAFIFIVYMVAITKMNPARFGDAVYSNGQPKYYHAPMHAHKATPYDL